MEVPAAPRVNLVGSVMARNLWMDASRSMARTDQFDNYFLSIDVLVVPTRRRCLEKWHIKVGWDWRWPKPRWPKMTN